MTKITKSKGWETEGRRQREKENQSNRFMKLIWRKGEENVDGVTTTSRNRQNKNKTFKLNS